MEGKTLSIVGEEPDPWARREAAGSETWAPGGEIHRKIPVLHGLPCGGSGFPG